MSLVLEACPISDALLTRISPDEEPLCGNAAVYAVIIIINNNNNNNKFIIIIIITKELQVTFGALSFCQRKVKGKSRIEAAARICFPRGLVYSLFFHFS